MATVYDPKAQLSLAEMVHNVPGEWISKKVKTNTNWDKNRSAVGHKRASPSILYGFVCLLFIRHIFSPILEIIRGDKCHSVSTLASQKFTLGSSSL